MVKKLGKKIMPSVARRLFYVVGEGLTVTNKLLPYLAAVQKAGKVIDPERSRVLKREYMADNSPEIAFFNECCTMRTNFDRVTDNQVRTFVYSKFREWCDINGYKHIPSKNIFTKNLDKYLVESKISECGAKFRKHNGRFYTFIYVGDRS